LNEELLYRVSGLQLFLILIALLMVSSLSGSLAGRRKRELVSDDVKSQVSALQGSLLGLLALLLGFTFSMTVSRYDLRKQLILEEANAIGTTYLRAGLLPAPYASQAIELLREYVGIRVALSESGGDETSRSTLQAANEKAEKLHNQLWSVARGVESLQPRSVATGLFIQSLNEVIDLHAKRLIALDNHVPEPVILMLWSVGLLSMGLTSYSCSLAGWRHYLATFMMALLIASVIGLIMDLDRPQRGFIRVSQKSMLMLQESMLKNRAGAIP
jgi:hypothetical protein